MLKILRSRSGRGAVPMKQNVIKNRRGEIVKYNHSKWLAISGFYGGNRSYWTVHEGPQLERPRLPLRRADAAVLRLRPDHGLLPELRQDLEPGHLEAPARRTHGGRGARWTRRKRSVEEEALEDVPVQPTFGKGIYKYMLEGG